MTFTSQLSSLFVNANAGAAIVSICFLVIGFGYVFNTFASCLLGALNRMGRPKTGMLLILFYYLPACVPLALLISAMAADVSDARVAVLISHVVAFTLAAAIYTVNSHRDYATASASASDIHAIAQQKTTRQNSVFCAAAKNYRFENMT